MTGCVLCGETRASVVAEGSDRLYGTTAKRFRVVRCDGCGALRLDPRPGGAELASYYPRNYWFSPDENAASRAEEAYRRLVLRDHVAFVVRALQGAGGAGPVLDAGCGGGLFLGMLRERGYRVLGLDYSAQAARVAWTRQRVPAFAATLDAAPLRPGSCRAVTMFHVLEHLEDPGAYLRAARVLLAPEGRLVVQVPNASSWQAALFGARWNGLDIPRHLVNFRERDLVALLEKNGFAVVRRKHFSLRDNPAGFASSVAPGLDPMARRVRGVAEGTAVRLAKDLIYFGLLAGAGLPFALCEAAAGAGSSLMVEAKCVG